MGSVEAWSCRVWTLPAVRELWSTGAYAPWTSPTLHDLLPELSDEEKQRLRAQGCVLDPEGIPKPPSHPVPCAGELEAHMIPTVRHALHHYNARHPGGEFDEVKPLRDDSVHFRGQLWFHTNFWARSRNSKKIKRFFAEVRYESPTDCSDLPFPTPCTAIVEACTILEEPLARYRSSCAFCPDCSDILHPMDGREFVCGSGDVNDWMMHECAGVAFITRRDPTSPKEGEERDLLTMFLSGY